MIKRSGCASRRDEREGRDADFTYETISPTGAGGGYIRCLPRPGSLKQIIAFRS